MSRLFSLPQEFIILREVVKKFIREKVVPRENKLDFEAVGLPDAELEELQQIARQAGLWCLGAPQKFGGAELSLLALCVVAEEATQHRLGAYNPALGAFGHEPPSILFEGSHEQIQKYVLPVIRGEVKRTFVAITEPSGGSDPARAIQTRAVLDGTDWVLNGTKHFISGVDRSPFGVVFARTGSGREGISAFIVETSTPGFSWTPIPVMRAWYPTTVYLEDCRVSRENLLGQPGEGFKLANKWLVRNRLQYAAGCIGLGVAALKLAIDYSWQREVFSGPLAKKQSVQWMIADSEIDLRSARWLTWDAADKADGGEDARTEASMAKLVATEAAGRVVDRVIQIFGGMGVAKELPLERWYRELRIKRIGEGPSEVHRMLIARSILGNR